MDHTKSHWSADGVAGFAVASERLPSYTVENFLQTFRTTAMSWRLFFFSSTEGQQLLFQLISLRDSRVSLPSFSLPIIRRSMLFVARFWNFGDRILCKRCNGPVLHTVRALPSRTSKPGRLWHYRATSCACKGWAVCRQRRGYRWWCYIHKSDHRAAVWHV